MESVLDYVEEKSKKDNRHVDANLLKSIVEECRAKI